MNIINSAQKYVYIFTPYLIIDHEMLVSLQNAAKRGVDVRIVTPGIPDKKFVYLLTQADYGVLIEKKLSLPEEIKAPVTQGKEAGTLYYTLNEKEIGSIRVLYDTTIPKATYQDYFRKTLTYFFSL